MAVHETQAVLAEKARIHPAAPLQGRGVRPFDLHPAVHFMLIGAWLGFVGILCATFMGPNLILPAAIFLVGIAALFVTPGLWARVADDGNGRRQSWAEFREEGIDTHTGRLTSGQALAQIMTLPVLVIVIAFFFAVLKATL